jgi:DNA-directed RNA polymerase specialized sigma24 family protein
VSPSASFTNAWEDMQPRLLRVLCARGCDGGTAEDIVQETGLRLYRAWATVRPDSMWALGVTIALNLLRDHYRSQGRILFVDEIPESPGGDDLESSVLARLELGKVARAMQGMNARYRAALLHLVDGTSDTDNRMVRSRARRQLREQLGRVSAGVGALREALARKLRAFPSDFAATISPAAQVFAAAVVMTASLGGGGLPSDGIVPVSNTSGHFRMSPSIRLSKADLPEVRPHLALAVGERRPAVEAAAKRTLSAEEADTWTPVTVDGHAVVTTQPPQGTASTDTSHTEASVDSGEGGVHKHVEADHAPPNCTAYVSADGTVAYDCQGQDRP